MMSDRQVGPVLLSLFVISIAVVLTLQTNDGFAALAVGTTALLVLVIMMVARVETLSAIPRPSPTPVSAAPSNMIDAIDDPILIVAEGRVEQANRPALALLGEHIVGQDVRLAIRHPRLATLGDGERIELDGIGARGHRLTLSSAALGGKRRLMHIVDGTERHLVEQARVDFVANASHELRTPLAAILGYAETLADDKAGGDPKLRARFLSIVTTEARRMQTLIDELISLSRIESEKHAPPDEAISLSQLINDQSGQWRDVNGHQRTDVILDVADGLPAVRGDRQQLAQVIHNLVGNAIKYGRPPIRIALSAEGKRVRLSISDQGDGIAPEHLPRLTERFYRVDPSRSRAIGGTGLGLSIVKHIVERHRGSLDIRSKVGVGTIVTVILPTAAEAAVTEMSSN